MSETSKVIIFDFDGVIAPTNILKTEILSSCVKDIIGVVASNDFSEHHKKNGGISRFVKFKRIVEKYNQQEVIYEKLLKLAKERIDKSLINLNYEKGFLELISFLKEAHYLCLIISGAPKDDLDFLINKWDINNYFEYILGSPKLKIEHFKNFRKNNLEKKIFCIGDSQYDLKCSESINATFILIYKYSEDKEFVESYDGIKFETLSLLRKSNFF